MIVLALFCGVAVLVAWRTPSLLLPVPGAKALSITTAVTGLGVCLLAAGQFRGARTTVDPRVPQTSSTLVTSGLYRYSRNPMYLGFALCLLALGLWLSHALALALVPAFVAYLGRFQVTPEERLLSARFGTAFDEYCRRVRRWI